MSRPYFLGIDTSNYTTSIALVDEQAQLVADIRQLLPVKSGQRGLRQSEALFWHVKHLPLLIEQAAAVVPNLSEKLRAAAVTTKPRPASDSYMPVFLAGTGIVDTLASVLQIPKFTLSHQESHIWAGLFSAKGPAADHFLALHLSGGTSEILVVTVKPDYRLEIQLLGGTADLHAGQLVDRVGVAMGLQFPAGRDLEQLALASTKDLIIPSYHHEGQISFSGAEAAALRMLNKEKKEDVARAVLLNIARATTKLIQWAGTRTRITQVLLVGGVCSNLILRAELLERLTDFELFFAEPKFSVDNAVGAAVFSALSFAGDSFSRHVF